MCIRDRKAAVQAAFNQFRCFSSAVHAGSRRRPSVEPQCAMLPTAAARGCGRGAGPVSYTHLTLPTICSV
eukprot:818896-Alexandrium_andersonii.AAC.1